ncbi:MAG: SET domain-containing protein-lysine N-methyltransferase [Bacteroidetes bacterium]|nr:MAG: SET domain-containing protein-lysine N-methyltransferase [Bacteroidota bacterium]
MLHSALYIAKAGAKGKGVFTKAYLPANMIIEVAPVIVLSKADRLTLETTKLYNYVFEWGNDVSKGAIGLGFVSMYNHESPSTCEYIMDYRKQTITVKTMRPIAAGEELTINYSAGWDDWKPVWFTEAKE